MKHGSLFSGIGGFDLAARWAGFTNVWQCEIDPYCQALLKKRFPEVETLYGDIREVKHPASVDIISGGFPCQPFSVAGKRRGMEDDRNLWPELLRIIEIVRPTWAVCENTYGILSLAAEDVCASLENIGYQTIPLDIASCAIGLPSVERHIWFVSTTNSERCERFREGKISEFKNIPREFQRKDTGEYRRWDISKPRVCRVGERIPRRLDRLKSLGNAIVPQVAYAIFEALAAIEGESQ